MSGEDMIARFSETYDWRQGCWNLSKLLIIEFWKISNLLSKYFDLLYRLSYPATKNNDSFADLALF